jgi:guanosine-3',5'-bis(diphosphate) 3'-pyrophosphohydrolase
LNKPALSIWKESCELSEYWEMFLVFLEWFYEKRNLWEIRNKEKIKSACLRMEQAHKWQKRKNNKPYHIHPYAVAQIYCMVHKEKISERGIIAAILHDNIENADKSWVVEDYNTIYESFWLEDAIICETLSKTSNYNFDWDDKTYDEYFSRFKSLSTLKVFIKKLLAIKWKSLSSNEISALVFKTALIKICDRIHNLRTMELLPPKKFQDKINETKKYLLPLAEEIWKTHPRVLQQLESALIVAETVLTRKKAESTVTSRK